MPAIEEVEVDVSTDWAAASEVQRQFMHGGPSLGNVDYSARCRQMRELGGDFYDAGPLSGNRLAIAIGDACGKGLAAALMIANVQSSLRTAMLLSTNDVPAALRAVNRQLYASSPAGHFATLFCGVFDRTDRLLRYVNAGHNPPLVIRRGGIVARLHAGAKPLGLFPDWACEEGIIDLRRGDLVVAYTDGITEAENLRGEQWGTERLASAAAAHADEAADDIVEAIFSAVDEFSGGQRADDATVAVLCVR